MLVGGIYVNADPEKTYAIGLQAEYETKGQMAVWSGDQFYSVEWDMDDFDSDYTSPQWILEPKLLEAPGNWEHPVGLAKEWGHKRNGDEWRIWTHETQTSSSEFFDPETTFRLIWVESFGPVWRFASVQEFTFSAFGAASTLVAATTTLALLTTNF